MSMKIKTMNMYYRNSNFYKFVGWVEDISAFKETCENVLVIGTDFTKEINKLVHEAENYWIEEHLRSGEFADYRLEMMEGIAKAAMECADVYYINEPAVMIVLGKMLGGAYVFKKI